MKELPRYCYAPKTRRDYDRKVAYYEAQLIEERKRKIPHLIIPLVRILSTARRERAELALKKSN